jgi:acyl-CoA reductase-like NAD-dependent aldehyde dehydrogenase
MQYMILQFSLQVAYGASFIEYYAEEAKRVYGDIIPPNLSDRRLLVLKQVSPFMLLYLIHAAFL